MQRLLNTPTARKSDSFDKRELLFMKLHTEDTRTETLNYHWLFKAKPMKTAQLQDELKTPIRLNSTSQNARQYL
jgi:hypothetical protein